MFVWILLAVVVLFGAIAFYGAPYVPTKKQPLTRLFDETYPVSEATVLVDIGSGDGVVLREAARRGARAVGYELQPFLVGVAWLLSRHYPQVRTRLADFWRTPLPDDVTVVYGFGDGRDIAKMFAKVEKEATRLGRPIDFISYGFSVPEREIVTQDQSFFIYRAHPLQDRGA